MKPEANCKVTQGVGAASEHDAVEVRRRAETLPAAPLERLREFLQCSANSERLPLRQFLDVVLCWGEGPGLMPDDGIEISLEFVLGVLGGWARQRKG